MVIAAMIIKHKMNLSDEVTSRIIQENPDSQYMCGLSELTDQPIFDTSMFVTVRKHITDEEINKMTIRLFEEQRRRKDEAEQRKDKTDDRNAGAKNENGGKSYKKKYLWVFYAQLKKIVYYLYEGGSPKKYNFLYKTSSDYYRSNNIYEDLMKANEVIFFGHSIDGMDFKYFQKFFQNASSEDASNYKKRYIRIITGDSASKINIEYNLRTKGIDPFDLYRLNDLDFIYTIGCENGNEHEKRKLSSFIIHLEKEKNENMMPRL